MSWLSEIGQRQIDNYEGMCRESSTLRLDIDQCVRDGKRMARVIKALVRFIRLNIDFDAPLRPVGLRDLPPDAKELLE